jgi:uncharacterized phage-associated protein
MELTYEFDRALQAAAYLLEKNGGKMSYIRLMKLMYIAEREWLATTGEPITGDRYCAMDRGPVLSTTLRIINQDDNRYDRKGDSQRRKKWREHIATVDFRVELRKSPGYGELSKGIMKKLDEVRERYRRLKPFEIVDLTHEFPEWRKYYEEETSTTIPWEEVLRLQGCDERMIADVAEEERSRAAADRIMGVTR